MRLNVPYTLASLAIVLTYSLATPNVMEAQPRPSPSTAPNPPAAVQVNDLEDPPPPRMELGIDPELNGGESDPEFRYRLRPGTGKALLMTAALAPLYWWWQSFLHEGSHCLMLKAVGGRVTSFKPYPHVTADGNFRFAGYYHAGGLSPTEEAVVLAAPLVMDLLWFTVSDLALTYTVQPGDLSGSVYLFGGMVCPLVDFLVNINGQDPQNDTNRLVGLTGMPKWGWMLIGNSLAAVGVWRIIHHGWRLFVDKEPVPETRQTRLSMAPIFSPEMTGLALRGRF